MLSPEDEELREIYAHFGLAIYLAQVLEHGLANALVTVLLMPRSAQQRLTRAQWLEAFEGFMGSKFQSTLGRLIGELRTTTPVSSNLEALLAEALSRRNWLAHHYFRERAEALVTSSGRATMLAELRGAQELFVEADELLNEELRPARERFGITDAILEMWAHAHMVGIPRVFGQ